MRYTIALVRVYGLYGDAVNHDRSRYAGETLLHLLYGRGLFYSSDLPPGLLTLGCTGIVRGMELYDAIPTKSQPPERKRHDEWQGCHVKHS